MTDKEKLDLAIRALQLIASMREDYNQETGYWYQCQIMQDIAEGTLVKL